MSKLSKLREARLQKAMEMAQQHVRKYGLGEWEEIEDYSFQFAFHCKIEDDRDALKEIVAAMEQTAQKMEEEKKTSEEERYQRWKAEREQQEELRSKPYSGMRPLPELTKPGEWGFEERYQEERKKSKPNAAK